MVNSFKPLFRPKRYKIFFGGRGGTKSWGFAQALILIAASKKTRILCTRELQGSIRESVHKLLSDTISRMNLDDFFNVGVNTIIGKNGSQFIFEGLKNNTTKIKSMEGVQIVWAEEAEAITEYSWDLLIPTIRAQGSEIWISFNPFDEMDATYQRYVAPYLETVLEHGHYEDDDVYCAKVGYEDNPFFPDELRKEMEKCKRENYNKYLHIWCGEPSADYEDSIIMPEWIDASIDAHVKLGFDARGVKSLGFDPADEGNDDKAIVGRHGSVITHCDNWGTGDVEDATVKAYQLAYDDRYTDFVYDNIGVGTGVKVKLRALNGNEDLSIQGFCASESPDNPNSKYKQDRLNIDIFYNKRAQYYWYLRDRFEATFNAVTKGVFSNPNDLISLPSDLPHLKLLKAELTRIQRKRGRNANSMIQIESKADMKHRGMKSPNLADALVYCFANKDIKTQWAKPLDYSRLDGKR